MSVEGSVVSSANFNYSTPAAPANAANVHLQVASSSISAYIAAADASNPGVLNSSSQTIGGPKTFNSSPIVPGLTYNGTGPHVVDTPTGGCDLSSSLTGRFCYGGVNDRPAWSYNGATYSDMMLASDIGSTVAGLTGGTVPPGELPTATTTTPGTVYGPDCSSGYHVFGIDVATNPGKLKCSADTGGSSSLSVNGSVVSSPNVNDTTPAAPTGAVNLKLQVSSSSISGYIQAAIWTIGVFAIATAVAVIAFSWDVELLKKIAVNIGSVAARRYIGRS